MNHAQTWLVQHGNGLPIGQRSCDLNKAGFLMNFLCTLDLLFGFLGSSCLGSRPSTKAKQDRARKFLSIFEMEWSLGDGG